MLRRWTLALLSLLLLLPLAGCWSRKELNELAIVVGLGLDRKGKDYQVTVQIVNPGQVSNRNGMTRTMPPVSTFTEWGKTVPEALRRMTTVLSKQLYFSHLRIVIFGEELAREGIAEPLDFISRDRQMRNDFFLVVAKDCKASDVLKVFSPVDPIPANNLFTKLANADRLWAAVGQITLDRLTIDLSAEGKDPSMTGIRIKGDKRAAQTALSNDRIVSQADLEYYGMAVFRKDKMVGWLDENETKTLNYLQGQVKETVATIDCPDKGILSLNIMNVQTRIRIGESGGEPVVNARLRIEADIADLECKLDMSKNDTLIWIRKQLERKVADLLAAGVERVQRVYHADIFGFGKQVHRQRPALWHGGDHWDETFSHLKVRIFPYVYIRRIGTIDQPIQAAAKE